MKGVDDTSMASRAGANRCPAPSRHVVGFCLRTDLVDRQLRRPRSRITSLKQNGLPFRLTHLCRCADSVRRIKLLACA